jgi:hypothetical protein
MPNRTHERPVESLAAEAAAYLAGGAGSVGGINGVQQEIGWQANNLVKWAQERGVFLTDSFFDGLEKYEDSTKHVTTEHIVYLGSTRKRVIKCTKPPGKFGWGHGINAKHCRATPLFYLQRLELMEQEFPTELRLEGIALGRSEYEPGGDLKPYIVTSQALIEIADEKHPNPTEEEIEQFMMTLGFRLIKDSCWNWFRESDGVIVTDTKVLNFRMSEKGIVPIDLVISKNMELTRCLASALA